jgi:hypothetical protein
VARVVNDIIKSLDHHSHILLPHTEERHLQQARRNQFNVLSLQVNMQIESGRLKRQLSVYLGT